MHQARHIGIGDCPKGMKAARRSFLLRALACAPRWSVSRLPGLLLTVPGLAAMAMVAPNSSHAVEGPALDSAPFFSAALARAVGGSMVAAEWRGDSALAERLADAALLQART